MNALAYIITRSAKNKLFELRRKPALLTLYAVLLFFLVFFIAVSPRTNRGADEYTDILWLKGIVILLTAFASVPSIMQGFAQGSTLFGMHDVNFLFVSPVSGQKILIYGIFGYLKNLAYSGIFLLFQSASISQAFGVGAGAITVIYFCFVFCAVTSLVLGIFVYSLTNGNEKRKNIAKTILLLMLLPAAISLVFSLNAANWNFSAGALIFLSSPVLSFTPVFGWVSAAAIGFIQGSLSTGFLFIFLLVLSAAVMLIALFRKTPDYYEDAMAVSETLFERKRNLAEGNINNMETAASRKTKTRVKATGIRGAGASAFFYKHVRESFRANRFGLWGLSSVFLVVGFLVYYLFMGQVTGGGEKSVQFITTLAVMMWSQLFLIGQGRGIRETFSHYIFMVPENPFKKIVWISLEVMLKVIGESIVVFALICTIGGESYLLGAAAAIAFSAFSFMIVALNFVSFRFTGSDINAGLLIMLYMFGIILIMVPGIIAAVVAGVLFPEFGLYLPIAALTAWEIAIALVCFFLSRSVLHNCDMVVARQVGQR
ncbi:MAG: putative ABC exporter domain-containing protein [Clostridiales bacterium]|jgi:hypothetical protein|nr:putative ABC exporter domain-containing protein [Clostridiales bacterium]